MLYAPVRMAGHVMLLLAFVFVHQVSRETIARMVAHLGTTHKTVTKNVCNIVLMAFVIEFLVFVNVLLDFSDRHVTIHVQNGRMEQTVWNSVHAIMKIQRHVIIRSDIFSFNSINIENDIHLSFNSKIVLKYY